METLPRRQPNSILHVTAQRHYWCGVGQLSIKTFAGGHALYEADSQSIKRVDDQSYLILNEGQPYSITIDAKRSVESFCVFFADGLANDVLRNLHSSSERLLADPWKSARESVRFFDRTYPHDDVLTPAIVDLRCAFSRASGAVDQSALDEQLHAVMLALIRAQLGVLAEVDSLSVVRAATREELYRRLHLARDFMHAAYDQRIELNDLARVACMSPHHFLRMFKMAFRQTPHQYLTMLRLQHAMKLLLQTEQSVTDICFSLGFESPGSFSWLFRRHVGASPTDYRLAASQRTGKPQF